MFNSTALRYLKSDLKQNFEIFVRKLNLEILLKKHFKL